MSEPEYVHLRMATQEQRDQCFLQVKMFPVQPRGIMALPWLFPKGLVSGFSFSFHYMRVKDRRVVWVSWWKCTTSAECKTKYLAVSPVTDKFEQLIKDSTEAPNIPISKVKSWWANKGRWDYGFHAILVLISKKSVFKRVGKIGFMQIILELHQPNMHIGYRVIPLSVHHSVTCQTPFLMESDPLCCKLLFVTEISDEE